MNKRSTGKGQNNQAIAALYLSSKTQNSHGSTFQNKLSSNNSQEMPVFNQNGVNFYTTLNGQTSAQPNDSHPPGYPYVAS